MIKKNIFYTYTFFDIFLDNFKFSGTIYTLPMHKYKNIYLETQNVSWKFNTSRLHIQLDNLFNGDKVLGE